MARPQRKKSSKRRRSKGANKPLIAACILVAVGAFCIYKFVDWDGVASAVGLQDTHESLAEQSIRLQGEMADLLEGIQTEADAMDAISSIQDLSQRQTDLKLDRDALAEREPPTREWLNKLDSEYAPRMREAQERTDREIERISANPALAATLDQIFSEIRMVEHSRYAEASHERALAAADAEGYQSVTNASVLEPGSRIQVLASSGADWQDGTVIEVRGDRVNVHLDIHPSTVFDQFYERSQLRIPDNPTPLPPGVDLAALGIGNNPMNTVPGPINPFAPSATGPIGQPPGFDPFANPGQAIINEMGAFNTITVVVEGDIDDATWDEWLMEMDAILRQFISVGTKTASGTHNGVRTMTCGPMPYIDVYADRIEFAEVVSIDMPTRTIRIRAK